MLKQENHFLIPGCTSYKSNVNISHTINLQCQEAFVNDKAIQDKIKKKIESEKNCNIKMSSFNKDFFAINIQDMLEKLIKYFINLENEENLEQVNKELENIINEINMNLKIINKKYEGLFTSCPESNIDLSISRDFVAKAKDSLSNLLKEIQNTKSLSEEMFRNEKNKQIIYLFVSNFIISHGIIAQIMLKRVGINIAISIVEASLMATPYGAFILLTFFAISAIYYFIQGQKKDEIKNNIFTFFSMLYLIVQEIENTQDGNILSIINFHKHIGGNILKYNDTFSYCTSKTHYEDSHFNKYSEPSICCTISISEQNNIKDLDIHKFYTQYSIEKQNISNNINNILQFSSFPLINKQILQDEDITTPTAFRHLQSLCLGYDYFLFIQTPVFTSTLALDCILQSFTQSKQNNAPHLNKTMLFITQPLNKDSLHFKMQRHIIDTIKENKHTKDNALFLSLVAEIKKEEFFDHFRKNIIENFKILEDSYNKIHYFQERLYKDVATEVESRLNQSFKKQDMQSVINDFVAITDFIFSQTHLFTFASNEKGKEHIAFESVSKITQMFAEFESILSHFIEFKIQQENKTLNFDEKVLLELRDMVREEINKHKLLKSIYAITHICNNAYFSNNAGQEVQGLRKLLEFTAATTQYKAYKTKLNQIEYLSPEDREHILDLLLPISPQILNSFFSEDEYEELSHFILYLIDLEIGGLFVYTRGNFASLTEYITDIHIDKKMIDKITNKDFYDKVREKLKIQLEDSLIHTAIERAKEFMEDRYPIDKSFTEIYAYLIDIIAKDMKDASKKRLQSYIDNSQMLANSLEELISKDNINHLQFILNGDKPTKHTNVHNEYIKNILDIIPNIDAFGNKVDGFIGKVVKNFYKGFGTPFVFFLIQEILDYMLPTLTIEELKRHIVLFSLGLRKKQNETYARWNERGEYFYLPKHFKHSFIMADFKASLLLDNSLDSGYCMHNPSLGIFLENSDIAIKYVSDFLYRNTSYNEDYFSKYQDTEATQIYKEAAKRIYEYVTNKPNKEPNMQSLQNKQKYKIKLKYAQKQGKKEYQSIGEEMEANRDFLIQLKRVAEYNYGLYSGKSVIEKDEFMDRKERNIIKENLQGNFIYNKTFVPTSIDIKD